MWMVASCVVGVKNYSVSSWVWLIQYHSTFISFSCSACKYRRRCVHGRYMWFWKSIFASSLVTVLLIQKHYPVISVFLQGCKYSCTVWMADFCVVWADNYSIALGHILLIHYPSTKSLFLGQFVSTVIHLCTVISCVVEVDIWSVSQLMFLIQYHSLHNIWSLFVCQNVSTVVDVWMTASWSR